jgi:hypothetical protein
MSRRATRITLANNSDATLTLVGKANPCHGQWTDRWEPPNQIPANSQGRLVNSWRSESAGIATGTEGWVKYVIGNQELVYIYWDNPFVWADSTKPIVFTVSTSDITPPCDQDRAGSEFPPVAGGALSHELFPAGAIMHGKLDADWLSALIGWPAIVLGTVFGELDIDLEFTVGLRQRGSVRQTINSFYDGRKGLRPLANKSNVKSLRKLFRM